MWAFQLVHLNGPTFGPKLSWSAGIVALAYDECLSHLTALLGARTACGTCSGPLQSSEMPLRLLNELQHPLLPARRLRHLVSERPGSNVGIPIVSEQPLTYMSYSGLTKAKRDAWMEEDPERSDQNAIKYILLNDVPRTALPVDILHALKTVQAVDPDFPLSRSESGSLCYLGSSLQVTEH